MGRHLATGSRASSERGDRMMRSETKTIYGVDVLGMIAMFKQLRKWRTIRKLRNRWNQSRRDLVTCRKFRHLIRWNQSRRDLVTCRKFRHLNHHADHFQVQQRYKHMREYVKSHQQRGVI